MYAQIYRISTEQNLIALRFYTLFRAIDSRFLLKDGEVFKVGKGPIPIIDTHVNCRCTTIRLMKGLGFCSAGAETRLQVKAKALKRKIIKSGKLKP